MLFKTKELVAKEAKPPDAIPEGITAVFEKNKAEKYSYQIGNIKELVGLPLPDQQFFIYTKKAFSAFAFVLYIIDNEQYIDELLITSFNMSRDVCNHLEKLVKLNKIGKLTVFLNNQFSKSPEDLVKFEGLQNLSKVRFSFAQSHAKIIAARTKENYYVLEGSGNSGKNAEIEQYLFTNDQFLYDFRTSFFIDLCN